jgi:hypothetical protein
MPMRPPPSKGFRPAKLRLKPWSPSCPPKYSSSVTDPMTWRMISAAAIVTIARY